MSDPGTAIMVLARPVQLEVLSHRAWCPWWRGVVAGCYGSGPQITVAQESAREPGRPADAGPVVVPQRRHQPRAVGGEHQVGPSVVTVRPMETYSAGASLGGRLPLSTSAGATPHLKAPGQVRLSRACAGGLAGAR
jgi:hypothetical protein